ncbi:MADS-box MEF2 type transcription factor MIG1 [Fagus crenata]
MHCQEHWLLRFEELRTLVLRFEEPTQLNNSSEISLVADSSPRGVESVLHQSDPNAVNSLNGVVQQVEAKLGLDLIHKAGLRPDQPPPPLSPTNTTSTTITSPSSKRPFCPPQPPTIPIHPPPTPPPTTTSTNNSLPILPSNSLTFTFATHTLSFNLDHTHNHTRTRTRLRRGNIQSPRLLLKCRPSNSQRKVSFFFLIS